MGFPLWRSLKGRALLLEFGGIIAWIWDFYGFFWIFGVGEFGFLDLGILDFGGIAKMKSR